jgi:CRISPR-associated protein (TIGR02710 family)
MDDQKNSPAVLFITVGSGSPDRLEETLYTPISKSISTGQWQQVVLLPSSVTLNNARELKKRHADLEVHIRPLPQGTSENDADACYGHFQQVIAEYRGTAVTDLVVDITRGTKAMSAALMLAAFRHRISRVRYVEGDRDPATPAVIIPGSERIRDVHAEKAMNHRTLDESLLLMQQGDFAAASHLLATVPSSTGTIAMKNLAEFYSAWDRLDYMTADEIPSAQSVPEQWTPFLASHEARQWVHQLADQVPRRVDPNYSSVMAKRIRLLAVDLTANGERRIRHRQFEDAVLRAYRVVEMIGQARLFDQGLDSGALPVEHPIVNELAEKLRKKKSAGFGSNRDGTLTAPRELAARLLKCFDDPLANDLLAIANGSTFRLNDRNHSILIHGFAAVGPSDTEPLKSLYEQLIELLIKDNPDAQSQLGIARSIIGTGGSAA